MKVKWYIYNLVLVLFLLTVTSCQGAQTTPAQTITTKYYFVFEGKNIYSNDFPTKLSIDTWIVGPVIVEESPQQFVAVKKLHLSKKPSIIEERMFEWTKDPDCSGNKFENGIIPCQIFEEFQEMSK